MRGDSSLYRAVRAFLEARGGDLSAAQEALYRELCRLGLGLARRYGSTDPDTMAADIASHALVQLGGFHATPAEAPQATAWVRTVARNRAVDLVRKESAERRMRRRISVCLDATPDRAPCSRDEPVAEAGAGFHVARAALRELLARARDGAETVSRVNPRKLSLWHDIFRMRVVERRSYAEIARRLSIGDGGKARNQMYQWVRRYTLLLHRVAASDFLGPGEAAILREFLLVIGAG